MSTATPPLPEPSVELVEVPDSPPPRATVELRGRPFPISEGGVPLLSLMKLATLAKRGVDSEDLEGLATLYELMRSAIADDAWAEFEAYANRISATGEELMFLVRDAVQAKAARPTQPPSGSPDGRSTTAPSWAGGSSSPGSSTPVGSIEVQHELEAQGRPDLALVVKRARQASTSTSPS